MIVDDEIYTFLVGDFLAKAEVVLGYKPPLTFDSNIAFDSNVPSEYVWARMAVNEVQHSATTMMDCESNTSRRRYVGVGNIFVHVFAPQNMANGLNLCAILCENARKRLYTGKTQSGIWFRNIVVRDGAKEDKFVSKILVGVYEADEIF